MSASPWRSSSLLLLMLLGGSALLSAVAGDDGASQPPTVLTAALNGSSSSHNSALDPVYYVKNLFIEQLYRHIRVSPIVDVTQGRGDNAVWPTIQLILAAVAPLAACVIVGILFCVIMPIAGLCCCCCRMCGKCGGKSPTMDPPRAKCERVSCGFALLALTTLMLGAAVVTFLSTDEIYKQLQTDQGSALSRYNPAIDALFDTVNATLQKPAEAVGKINQSFGGILDANSGSIFSALSGVPLDFVPVTRAALSTSNGSISSILVELDALRNAQSNISHLNLSSCCVDSLNCTVTSNANYSSFVDTTLRFSSAIVNATDALLKVNGVYEKLHEGILKSIYSAKSETASTVKKLQTDLEKFAQSFDAVTAKNVTSLSASLKDSIASYSKYVRIGGFALGAIVALVVLLLYLGLCCGLCGRRVGDDSSSCNKGSGAKSLLAAVGFMFMFSWLLMLVTMILFPAGGVDLVCWLVDGSLSSKFESMNEVGNTPVDLKGVNITVGRMESTLRECRDKSLLSVVEAYVPDASQIVTNLTNKDNWNVDDLRRSIGSVAVQLPADIDSTISSLTSVNSSLHDLLDAVDRLQALVVQKPFFPDPSVVLTNISNITQCDTVKAQFEAQASAADASWTQLQQLTGLRQLLDNVRQSIAAAHTGIAWLQSNMSGTSVTLPTQVFDGILSNLTSVINQTAQQLTNYPCSPLYNSAKNVADLFCSAMLDPVDALWFSLGWATALFVPVIIIALCLVSLYRREEPYKSHKDGRDYQGYEDEGVTIRDNVPLDNMPSRKSHYPYNESYLNAAYNGPHDDGRGDGSVPPPYYGMYTGGGGASNGGHFPRVVHSPTNGDVTFGGPGPSVPMSQKRY